MDTEGLDYGLDQVIQIFGQGHSLTTISAYSWLARGRNWRSNHRLQLCEHSPIGGTVYHYGGASNQRHHGRSPVLRGKDRLQSYRLVFVE